MGMLASDELSSTDVYVRVERDWALPEDMQRSFGISHLLRFKDDVLVVLSSSSGIQPFVQEMQKRAGHYRLTVDATSECGVPMFDIWVHKCARFKHDHVLETGVYVKPTFQGLPLHTSSMHPFSVHVSWPIGRLLHVIRVCSSFFLYREAATRFLNTYVRYSPSNDVMCRLFELHDQLKRGGSTGGSCREKAQWFLVCSSVPSVFKQPCSQGCYSSV